MRIVFFLVQAASIFQSRNSMHIVFVCTANICRSVMSEGILKKLFHEHKLQKRVTIESAGTDALPGKNTNNFTMEVCKEHGIDVSRHRSRQLTKSMLEEATLVICLAVNHHEVIHRAYPEFRMKVVLLKEFGQLQPPKNFSVADPIGAPKKQYGACFKEIEGELKRIFPFLEQRARTSQSMIS